MKKLGFFGGCFNPVTNAHINLMKEVIQKENLDKIYFVPMGDLYQKEDLIPLENRVEMLKIDFENESKFDILKISNLDKKMAAIDTFHIIDKKFKEDERFFIMGSDNYQKISKWKASDELINNYQYIILDRENEKVKNISSTQVRNNIKESKDVKKLVSPKVYDYIKQKNLYK